MISSAMYIRAFLLFLIVPFGCLSVVFAQGSAGVKLGIQNIYTVVVLPFATEGLTESSAKSLAKGFSQNITNTNRYQVISSDETERRLIARDSDLLDCYEFSCGIQISKDFEADFVVISSLVVQEERFFFTSRLVNVFTGDIVFEDTQITREQEVNEGFYKVANRMVEYTPVDGEILFVKKESIIISLGREDRLKINDQLVVYRQEGGEQPSASNTSFLDNTLNRAIAIVKIFRVSQRTAEGKLHYVYLPPTLGDKVKTYANRNKQVALVAVARREIDENFKIVEEEGIEAVIPVSITDKERTAWERRVIEAQDRRNTYWWLMLGGGTISLYSYSQNQEIGGVNLLAWGITGFLTYKYLEGREDVEKLRQEGRYRGYIDNSDVIDSQSLGLNSPTLMPDQELQPDQEVRLSVLNLRF